MCLFSDGFLIASETDYKQCRALANRIPKLTSPNLAVVNLNDAFLQDLHLPNEVCNCIFNLSGPFLPLVSVKLFIMIIKIPLCHHKTTYAGLQYMYLFGGLT
jgi:hypothetical protein